jgi:N-acetylglutamate synthase-like GNAT family acetyltransferase
VGKMNELVRFANQEDTARIVAYLNKAKLGTDGVSDSIDYFLIMEDEQKEITATIGIEPVSHYGLLRSLAISPSLKEAELLYLFNKVFFLAKEKSLSTIFLATNKPESLAFFRVLGFSLVNKENLPEALFGHNHVQHILTVDNSIFMELSL